MQGLFFNFFYQIYNNINICLFYILYVFIYISTLTIGKCESNNVINCDISSSSESSQSSDSSQASLSNASDSESASDKYINIIKAKHLKKKRIRKKRKKKNLNLLIAKRKRKKNKKKKIELSDTEEDDDSDHDTDNDIDMIPNNKKLKPFQKQKEFEKFKQDIQNDNKTFQNQMFEKMNTMLSNFAPIKAKPRGSGLYIFVLYFCSFFLNVLAHLIFLSSLCSI